MRFDKEALTWDDVPRRVELAKKVVEVIKPFLDKNDRVLDFGCGTGLVGINLSPYVKEVVGIDISKGMVDVFNKKAKLLNLNAKAYVKDIFEIKDKFDIVVSSMTLHHIKDIKSLSKKLYEITDRVFIVDLCKEDGTFHTRGNEDVYHYGFLEDELREYFNIWNMNYKIIHHIKKDKTFPVFLLELTKN